MSTIRSIGALSLPWTEALPIGLSCAIFPTIRWQSVVFERMPGSSFHLFQKLEPGGADAAGMEIPFPPPKRSSQDDSIPWTGVQAFAAGKTHLFEVKTVSPVRWLGTGGQDVRLLVVRPLAYRPRKGSRLLYRDPAYLLCTDPDLPLDRLLQSYLWRWEIELNFREEKTLLGVGEAQVRTPTAVKTVPSFMVAAYAFLLLAGTGSQEQLSTLPEPKWRTSAPAPRASTARLIGLFRSELWGKAMGVNLSHFAESKREGRTPALFEKSLPSAVCYAFK
jgi:hypothetical protein